MGKSLVSCFFETQCISSTFWLQGVRNQYGLIVYQFEVDRIKAAFLSSWFLVKAAYNQWPAVYMDKDMPNKKVKS